MMRVSHQKDLAVSYKKNEQNNNPLIAKYTSILGNPQAQGSGSISSKHVKTENKSNIEY